MSCPSSNCAGCENVGDESLARKCELFCTKTLPFWGTSMDLIICKESTPACASIISQAVELYFLQSIPVVQVVVVSQQMTVSGIWFLSIFLLTEELWRAPNADLCSEQQWQRGTSSAAALGHPWIFRGENAVFFLPLSVLIIKSSIGQLTIRDLHSKTNSSWLFSNFWLL